MIGIRLEAADGAYVCTGHIPAFPVLPEVVTWGTRIFQLYQKQPPIYRECFVVDVVHWNR